MWLDGLGSSHQWSQPIRAVIGCLSENECTSSKSTKLVHPSG